MSWSFSFLIYFLLYLWMRFLPQIWEHFGSNSVNRVFEPYACISVPPSRPINLKLFLLDLPRYFCTACPVFLTLFSLIPPECSSTSTMPSTLIAFPLIHLVCCLDFQFCFYLTHWGFSFQHFCLVFSELLSLTEVLLLVFLNSNSCLFVSFSSSWSL